MPDWTSEQAASGTVRGKIAFFDVRIFNPTAQSCCNQSLPACYRRHELEKRRHYEDRVTQIEHGCFTPPIVFSTSGGMGPSATVFFKRLASLLSTKRNAHYGSVMSWIRCKISFALIHSAILCLRGTRSRPIHLSLDFDRALAECRIQLPQLPDCCINPDCCIDFCYYLHYFESISCTTSVTLLIIILPPT